MTAAKYAICCARCGRESPADLNALTGDGGGEPALLPVVEPPEGWLGDPDGDGVVCAECADPSEIVAWMNSVVRAERLTGGEPPELSPG